MAEMEPRPNIKFIGRDKLDRKTGKLIEKNDPIEQYQHVRETVVLPSADVQRDQRKFYHEKAAEIRFLFPTKYKLIVKKGGKKKRGGKRN